MQAAAGGQGFVKGMQAGSAFGPYGAAIGGAIGLAVGLFGGDPNKAAKEAQTKFNNEVIKNTAVTLFDAQRAQQVNRMQTARALQAYQAQGKTQVSQVRAGIGAADLIGSTAQALAQSIDFQTQQAQESVRLSDQISYENYLSSIDATTNRGVNSLQRSFQAAPQQALDIGAMYQAGKGMYDMYKQSSQQGGFNAGLQFGSGTPQSASMNPMPSNYSLPSNMNLQFKGF